MDLEELVKTQVEFDRAHGFPVEFESVSAKYSQVSRDLVGLFGEIGEFSNIVKKITLHLERPTEYRLSLDQAEAGLREELIDALIYVVRLSAVLGVNIQHEYESKMAENAIRYGHLR